MAVRPLGFSLAAALALLAAAFPAALPAEPYLVKDLNTSPLLNDGSVDLSDRGTVPGVSYFAAADPAHGTELWRSDVDGLWRTDGTAAGTFLLKRMDELATQPDSFHDLPYQVLWHGLFFGILYSGEMIRSDSTPEGTFRIASLSGGSVRGLAPLDSEILVLVGDSSGKGVLWSTRGTADTTGPKLELEAEMPAGLTGLSGDRAVFLAGPSEFVKSQLWMTDGTAAGTRRLALPGSFVYDGLFFATGDGRALFFRYSPESSLWITDGTEAGTHEVRSFGNAPGSSGPREQAALGGKLVFSATVPNGRAPPFVSDGTADGTGMLSGIPIDAFSFFRFGDRLLFSATRPSHPGRPAFLGRQPDRGRRPPLLHRLQ